MRLLKTLPFAFIWIILFLQTSYGQQCLPGGSLFVNEFSGTNGSGEAEWIELVVVGDPANPTAPVDLEGWIIDDNNNPISGVGTATGHLRLGPLFNAMIPGTIILIYDGEVIPFEPWPDDGTPNADGVWVVPHDHPDIFVCQSNPSVSPPNPNYEPCSNYSYTNWSSCMGLSNSGDGVQARQPGGIFYHGLSYGLALGVFAPGETTGNLMVGTIQSSLDCGDWFDVANYSDLTPTPGEPNTILNEVLINRIAAGTLDCDNIDEACTLYTCPEIEDVVFEDDITGICVNTPFDVTATGLAYMSEDDNGSADHGVRFLYFNGINPPADPYSGGTDLGTVPFSSLTGTHPNQTATTTVSFPNAGEYNICVVLNPEFTQLPDCEPFACRPITIWEEPTAQLSGTHDFCPGDCHQISVQISGGEEPYTVTFRIIAFIFNFTFTVPSYDLDNQLTICNVGTLPPSYDIAQNILYVPTIFSASGTLIIDEIIDANGCVASMIDPNNLTLNFYDVPDIFEPSPLVECNEDGDDWAAFDLSVLVTEITGGTGVGVHFYEDFEGNIEIFNVTNYISGTNTIYARIEAGCISEMVEVELVVEFPPDAGEDAESNICNDASGVVSFFSLINSPNTSGIWTDDDNSGVNIDDPENVSFNGITPGIYHFTYTVFSNGVCPDVFTILTIEVSSSPNPGDDGLLNLCQGADSPVDLFDFLGDVYESGGIWSDESGSGVDISDPTQVDFSTLGIGIYYYSYTVTGNGVCPPQSSTLTVNVITEPNPGTAAQIFACNDGTTVDLNSALGLHDTGGIWSDENGAAVDLSDPSTVDFSGVNPGNYGFLYIILGNGVCPEVSALITVIVEEALNPGTNGQITICEGSVIPVSLTGIIGNHDGGGMWIDNNSSGADISDPSMVDLSLIPEGNYLFSYHIPATIACSEQISVVTVNITPNADPGTSTNVSVCSSGNTLLDFESLLGSHDAGGTWADLDDSGVDLTNTFAVDFSGVAEGNYRFSYTIPATANCPQVSSVITVLISSTAFAGNDQVISVCAGYMGTVNLYDFLSISGITGNWAQAGGNPVDISDPTSIDLSTSNEGDYVFEFSLSNDCGQDTAVVTIKITAPLNAGSDYTTEICVNTPFNLYSLLGNHDPGGRWEYDANNPVIDPNNFVLNTLQTINLSYIISGNAYCSADTAGAIITGITIPDAGTGSTLTVCQGAGWNQNLYSLITGTNNFSGVWQQMNGPSTLNLSNPNIVSIPGSFIGTYTLEYSVQNQCGIDVTLVYIIVQEAQSAGNDYSVVFCESQAAFSLTTLLTGESANGIWRNPLGVIINNPNNVPMPPPGNYTFLHILNANGNCPADTAYAYIEVIEEPFAGNDNQVSLCENSEQAVNLIQLLGPGISNNGVWSDMNNSTADLTNPNAVNFAGIFPGTYTFIYTVPGVAPCPADNAEIDVTIQDAPNTGTCDTLFICNGTGSAPVNLPLILNGEDTGGFFRELTSSGVNLVNPANINFSSVLPGRYIFEYYFPASGVCGEQSTRIVINVAGTSTITLEYDFCPNDSITIGSTVYSLNNPFGTEVFTNVAGCDSTVIIRIFPKMVSFSTSSTDENCFGAGSFSIDGQNDATLPLTLTNNTLGSIQINTVPYTITGIGAGNYNILITDVQGCSVAQLIKIEEFPGFELSMEDEVSIYEGNGYQIDVTTDMIPVSITWTPAENLSCNNCLNPYATPAIETMYTILIRDAEGCEITDSILIRVERKGDIYIPNVFSPNGDDINPVFYAKSFGIQAVYHMSIFDRWGELMYRGEGLNFNDPFSGWDGSFRGTTVNPGVYIYLIEVVHSDGTKEIKSGDILLLR